MFPMHARRTTVPKSSATGRGRPNSRTASHPAFRGGISRVVQMCFHRTMGKVKGTAGYERIIGRFVEATETVDFFELHKPFLRFIPSHSCRVLDLGAGVGRDASVLASLGHKVSAVEPMREFLTLAKSRYESPSIEWIEDSLPELIKFEDSLDRYDFVLASAVWHHLDEIERSHATARIRALTRSGGYFAVSLRHGPAGGGTHVFPIDGNKTVAIAEAVGFDLRLHLRDQPSLIHGKDQVRWSKLVFQRV